MAVRNEAMDQFCGSDFWNGTISWNTDDPDFTRCFEKTVLFWIPCVFLWVFAPLDTFYMINSTARNIPWNYLNITKLFVVALLIILTGGDLGYAVHENGESADIYTPIIKIVTFLLAGVLQIYNRVRGIRSSGISFFFWLLLLVCGIFQYRTEIRSAVNEPGYQEMYPFVSYMVYFPLVLAEFLLVCWADRAPQFSELPVKENPCPEQNASFLSRLVFSWFDKLAWQGFRKPLETKDLWSMNPEDTAQYVVPLFEKYWKQSQAKSANVPAKANGSSASFRKTSSRVEFSPPAEPTGVKGGPRKTASVMPAIFKAFGPTFLLGSLLKLVQDLLTFVSPQILSLLIAFVDSDQPMWKGFLYAGLMLVTACIQTIVLSQYFHRMFLVGLRIRTALVSTIYRKALLMSSTSRKESTVGEIVNLMSVDAQRFMDLTTYLNMIWSAPLQIGLALYFLWNTLGPSVLAGLAVMIVLIPVNGVVANQVKKLQIRQMKYKDERVKLMNEVLSGIKVLKLYAWEPSFELQILKIRDKEVQVLKQAAYLNAGTSFIWSCAPFLVSLVTFATYILVDPTHVLDAQKTFVSLTLFNIMRMPMSMLPMLLISLVQVSLVTFATFVLSSDNNVLDSKTAFVSLSLFNILRFPLSMLPMMITNMVQASVSIKRMNHYMNSDEIDPGNVQHSNTERNPIVVENGNFSWGPGEDLILKDINLSFKQGGLVAVVGSVGSGKSSLISAILGEMEKVTGRVNTKGAIAYVPQQAWIQNASLRDNIVFGQAWDSGRYARVVDACALKPDIAMLPAGDQTEIGEKGINLSGGQKQRVSLARAVYSDADVYLLDDPLSAVDSHVGKHIFENVIGPGGLLDNKTRVLVTHGITFLPKVDVIVVIKDGEVTELGTYRELLQMKGAFAEFLVQHLSEIQGEDPDMEGELGEIKAQLSSTIGAAELDAQLRLRSRESESDTNSLGRRSNSSLNRQVSVESSAGGIVARRSSEKGEIPAVVEKKVGQKLIETEKSETGSVKWNVYSHYLRSIGLPMTVATVFFNMVFQAFSIGSNAWLAVWSNDPYQGVNGTEMDTGKRDMYLGVYGALGAGQVLAVLISTLALALGTLMAATHLHKMMLLRTLRNPMEFFDTTPIGRVVNRFAKDVDVVDNTIPMNIRAWLNCFLAVIATLVVISYSTPIFVVVIIPTGIVYYFIQRFYVATSRQLKRLESVSRSPIYSHFGESITGSSTIRAYGVQGRFIAESEQKVDYNQVCYYPSIVANRWLAVRLEMVGNLIIFFSALFAVLGRDTMNPGIVGLSVSYALQITQTLNWLVRMTSDVETNIVAVERIKEYGETEQEAAWERPETVLPKDWPTAGLVNFHQYEARYRQGLELVLRGISFTVNGGEKVGIVGRTGAGKSSLTLGLFRIVEAAGGRIDIDGVDISTLGLHALRSRLTIIPQDPVLFSGPLRINLDPFDSHSDQELWHALDLAHLNSFVKGLAAGLNHEITEGGDNLSVGQRQLICLARALLRKTRVLVLDEATAAVDLETDDLIQATIRKEFKECTVLTIAHRLNTILDSDRVMVLDKGKVVEFSAPTELLQNKASAFYSMAKDAGIV